jgi:hypothetical protein
MALHGSLKRLNGTLWYQINTRKIDQCQGIGIMTYRKLAFWRHKAPKQNIHGDHSRRGLHRHFQPANGDPPALPHTPTGLLHMSGRIAEVTVDLRRP